MSDRVKEFSKPIAKKSSPYLSIFWIWHHLRKQPIFWPLSTTPPRKSSASRAAPPTPTWSSRNKSSTSVFARLTRWIKSASPSETPKRPQLSSESTIRTASTCWISTIFTNFRTSWATKEDWTSTIPQVAPKPWIGSQSPHNPPYTSLAHSTLYSRNQSNFRSKWRSYMEGDGSSQWWARSKTYNWNYHAPLSTCARSTRETSTTPINF